MDPLWQRLGLQGSGGPAHLALGGPTSVEAQGLGCAPEAPFEVLADLPVWACRRGPSPMALWGTALTRGSLQCPAPTALGKSSLEPLLGGH